MASIRIFAGCPECDYRWTGVLRPLLADYTLIRGAPHPDYQTAELPLALPTLYCPRCKTRGGAAVLLAYSFKDEPAEPEDG